MADIQVCIEEIDCLSAVNSDVEDVGVVGGFVVWHL